VVNTKSARHSFLVVAVAILENKLSRPDVFFIHSMVDPYVFLPHEEALSTSPNEVFFTHASTLPCVEDEFEHTHLLPFTCGFDKCCMHFHMYVLVLDLFCKMHVDLLLCIFNNCDVC